MSTHDNNHDEDSKEDFEVNTNEGEETSQDENEVFLEEKVAANVASRLGWRPKEQWTRDPTKWRDAKTFLEETPKEVETLKERVKAQSRAQEAYEKEALRAAREQVEAELRQATKRGDDEAAVAAHRKMESMHLQVNQAKTTTEWVAKNPWFNEDKGAADLAYAIADREYRDGASTEKQLEAAEEAVRRVYPHLFENTQSVKQVAKETRKAPEVQSGDRGGHATPKAKSWKDIPIQDRKMIDSQVKNIVTTFKKDENEVRERIVSKYFANKGE